VGVPLQDQLHRLLDDDVRNRRGRGGDHAADQEVDRGLTAGSWLEASSAAMRLSGRT
jgi:hypothetical protein